jgi:ubiquinone/menaquinone biosynthesis C-methylase UbiE
VQELRTKAAARQSSRRTTAGYQSPFPEARRKKTGAAHLPVADASIDVIISNCVINLSPDKPQGFRLAFRVLKHGGRLAISDVVTPIPLPDEIKSDLALHTGRLAGASLITDLQAILEECGFR